MAATYQPGGRRFKHNRACPRIWRTKNGRYLFWFNNHSGSDFWPRNPVWISAGIEKAGYIHWSQPEILLYGPQPKFGMSYPDLIEENGRYWMTETQKTIARIHEIDVSLLEGMWNQGRTKGIAQDGLVLSLHGETARSGATADMPRLPLLTSSTGKKCGFSVDFTINFNDLSPGQIILDSRNEAGCGVVVKTGENAGIRLEMNDGQAICAWDCATDTMDPGAWHHVVIIVDGAAKIISFVIDGSLSDGGDTRHYGWSRFSNALDDVNGSKILQIGASLRGRLKSIRFYNRYLRTSEAIGNFHAQTHS